jgi:nucleotide-binding universal stress UspA family protein
VTRFEKAPILVGFNPHTADRGPVEFGAAVSRALDAPLVVIGVRPADDEPTLDHVRLDLQRHGLSAEVRAVDNASVGMAISNEMKDLSPQMVVLGATRRGAARSALLGTTIEHVIHDATTPVTVVPHGYQAPAEGLRSVGAAYAPTDEGREALRAAAAVARVGGVKMKAIQVLDPKHAGEQASGMLSDLQHSSDPAASEHAAKIRGEEDALRAALAEQAPGVEAEIDVLFNDPGEGLVAASRHVDLLIMGSRARSPRKAVVLGSVSRHVAEHSECPVLILPRGADEATDALIAHAAERGG